jgi:hypothetical protein
MKLGTASRMAASATVNLIQGMGRQVTQDADTGGEQRLLIDQVFDL